MRSRAAAAWVGLGFCGWVRQPVRFAGEGLTDHDAVAIRSLDCTKFLHTFRSDLLTLAPSSPSHLKCCFAVVVLSQLWTDFFLVQIADFAAFSLYLRVTTYWHSRENIISFYCFYSLLREVCGNKFRDQAWRSYPDLHLQSDSSTFQSEISLEGRVHSGSASANRWLGCGQMLAPVLSMALKFGV